MIAFQEVPSRANTPATPAPQATTGAVPAQGAKPAMGPGFDGIWVFIPVLVGMVLLSVFSGRKQRKQKEKLLGGLKKHDRVVTTGGMIGFVAEVKPDVVVLKIEEGRDTRVTFTRDAIAGVIKAAEGTEESAKTSA